jgi:hypothetical protein
MAKIFTVQSSCHAFPLVDYRVLLVLNFGTSNLVQVLLVAEFNKFLSFLSLWFICL